MKQRTRIYYTEEQRAVMWDRWQKGESLHEIGRLFDRFHTSFQRIVSETGGATNNIRLLFSVLVHSTYPNNFP